MSGSADCGGNLLAGKALTELGSAVDADHNAGNPPFSLS
jgi:hypothetical protein